jgi:hypothetical protein
MARIPIVLWASVSLAVLGCSAGESEDVTGTGGAATGGSSGTGGGETGGTGGVINVPDASSEDDSGFTVCEAVHEQGDRLPLTLYVMYDRSASMSDGSKWTDASTGFAEFLQDPASSDITMGLVFFPREPLLANEPACSFKNYEEAHVDFGTLPSHAQALLDGLAAATPSGAGTPIYPAIGGALNRLISESNEAKAQGNVENFAVLLVTDGKPQAPPTSCAQDPLDNANIVQLASNGFDKFGIRTFVVALPGTDQVFANGVASAGGTGQAIQVSQTNMAESFRLALASVRGDALGCEFALPPQEVGSEYSTGQVNVTYEKGPPNAETLEAFKSEDCTDAMGWRYDDESAPTTILLCPDLCDQVKADGLAEVVIELGCPTRVK